ncbi:hypothetical protein J7K99_00310 [bacterium]|nr:hypothetical protein [bacterium]
MRTWQKIIEGVFVITAIFMLFAAGCSNENPSSPDNTDNSPPDTEEVDTLQPDSTDFGTIELIDTIETSDFPAYFTHNDEVLIYASSYRVYIMSLDNPESPSEIAQFPPDYPYTSMIKDIDVHDNTLIIALDYPAKKLVFVDISDPSSPNQISELSLDFSPAGICASEYYVFVGYGTMVNGDIVNYSEPTAPAVIGELPCSFESADYFYYELYCCSSTDDYVYQVDLEDISSPSAQAIHTGKYGLDIKVTPWGNVYVACGVTPATNVGGFAIYSSDNFGIVRYSEDIDGYAATNVDFQDNFVYLLLRSSPGGTDYSVRGYFSYHPDQTTQIFEQTLTSGNCVAATNHYVYVGARSTTSGGVIYVFHHQY